MSVKLSPPSPRDPITPGQVLTPAWELWFLNLYTVVQGLVVSAATAVTGLAALAARVVTLEADALAWTPVTFDAATFTANGAMTWSVDAADVVTHEYGLIGDLLFLAFHVNTSDVGGVADSELRIALPSGYLTAGWSAGSLYYSDAGGSLTTGSVLCAPGEAWVSLYKSPVANWTLTTGDNTRVIGSIALRVVAA